LLAPPVVGLFADAKLTNRLSDRSPSLVRISA
jgi:hypothetical protein